MLLVADVVLLPQQHDCDKGKHAPHDNDDGLKQVFADHHDGMSLYKFYGNPSLFRVLGSDQSASTCAEVVQTALRRSPGHFLLHACRLLILRAGYLVA